MAGINFRVLNRYIKYREYRDGEVERWRYKTPIAITYTMIARRLEEKGNKALATIAREKGADNRRRVKQWLRIHAVKPEK